MAAETGKIEIELLKHIQGDIALMKQKVFAIEEEIGEISSDLHREVRPEYLKKLGKIEKSDKRTRFKDMKELDRYFGI